jgi:phosphatidylinositol glycan class N
MTNKGSHGDGDKDNTETPFVCWGAGIKTPFQQQQAYSSFLKRIDKSEYKSKDNRGIVVNSPTEWVSDHLIRVDMQQADIAPLMVPLMS